MEPGPYQAPKANLETSINFKQSIGWKIYFFIITTLSALGLTSLLVDPAAGLSEYIDLAIWIIATVGLFGFVFVKPILNPRFWFITLIVYLLYTCAYYFITNIDLRAGMEGAEYYVTSAFGWLISIPAFYGLYAYSKPSDPSWVRP